ncbi:MFS transporter [Chryseobacterium sp. LAM-KRS1]|uniref:MFS transporter n=1 Tax=Chryseobacterium sp. LAM-KRS1 TaxID=2715754 RepID=UPI0015541AC5|nr:MFS transporter [Chryseobacterium sp. LAM-KRS1]
MESNRVKNYRWVICSLLFFGTTINYLDRQVLSLLHPVLEEQFQWSNSDYGIITAIFQLSYAFFMLLAGRFVDKMGTKKGYAIALVIWSVGAIIHAFAIPMGEVSVQILGVLGFSGLSISVTGFIIARLILGVGESANFPAAIKATAEYFPKKERALATGIFNSGSNVGAILAPLTVPWLAYYYGWQSAFIIIGSLGFFWLILWLIFYDTPVKQKRLSPEELNYILSDSTSDIKAEEEKEYKVSWLKLLTFKQTWSYSLAKFLTDGVWWFFLFWLPSYLNKKFHLSGSDIILPLSVLYTMTMIGSICGGWLSMYFINKGFAPYDGRMKAMFYITLVPLIVLFLVQPLSGISYWVPVILIGLAASAHQAWSANVYTTASDIFPKAATASITGIGGMAGGMGGALVSFFVGKVFDYYHRIEDPNLGYTLVFSACAVAYLVAWIIMKLLVPKAKIIRIEEITNL